MKFVRVLLRAVMAVLIISIADEVVEARPELYPVQDLIYSYPSASQQTTVIRDLLGNQGTAYAYQNHNGISASAVAVSRSDNSKTLAYVPVPAVAPVLAAHQTLVHDPYHAHAQYAHHHHAHYQGAISPAVAYSDYHHHGHVYV